MSDRVGEVLAEYWREHFAEPGRELPRSTCYGSDRFVVETAIDALDREFS